MQKFSNKEGRLQVSVLLYIPLHILFRILTLAFCIEGALKRMQNRKLSMAWEQWQWHYAQVMEALRQRLLELQARPSDYEEWLKRNTAGMWRWCLHKHL